MLDLKRLRFLREVAAAGSFSRAAEELFVSQSAVSQQVSALEAEVGVPLLIRLREGPVLTEAGEVLVGHADAAIARLEQAERELTSLAGLESGELRLVSFPSASATIMTAAASRFIERRPDVRLTLAEGDPEDAIPALKRGRHDLALVYDFELHEFEDDRDLDLTLLLTEEMHLAVPANHRLAGVGAAELTELAAEPWLCGTENSSCRELAVLSCREAGFEPDLTFESNDYYVIQSLVAAGMGVSLLPDLALVNPHAGVSVVRVKPQPPIRRVWAATLTAGARSAATDEMVSTLVDVGKEFVSGTSRPLVATAG